MAKRNPRSDTVSYRFWGLGGTSLGAHVINSASRTFGPHACVPRRALAPEEGDTDLLSCLCSRFTVQMGHRQTSKTFLEQVGSTFKDAEMKPQKEIISLGLRAAIGLGLEGGIGVRLCSVRREGTLVQGTWELTACVQEDSSRRALGLGWGWG